TGLAGGTGTGPFLVGVGWWEQNGAGWEFRLEQYLIEDFCHEGDMMQRLAARVEPFRAICTYNGKTFDIPLLRTRATLQRIPPRVFRKHQLDLLHFSRRMWRGMLPSVSLKQVELNVLGIDRGPDLDGALIPSIFFHMARTGRAERMAAVLDHNAWDIITLSSLLRRLACIAADPMGCGLLKHHEEFAAAARWLEARRLHEDAGRAWTAAIERCADEAAERTHMERLARLHKRLRRWPDAVEIWQELARRPLTGGLGACLELAKYHEHVARDHAAALQLVGGLRAGIELERELAAITRRPVAPALEKAAGDLEKREARLRLKVDRARKKIKRPA
ncbi:MAG: ribonuclease H-like domain-containing protein, partial [FCB group bacterium]|nr:ribonuclease H-like domain-containing protein [FCB group bacterium]